MGRLWRTIVVGVNDRNGASCRSRRAVSTVYGTHRLAMFAHRLRRIGLVFADQVRITDDIDGEDCNDAADRASFLGNPGIAHAIEEVFSLRQKTELSLSAPSRKRFTVKIGLSASPALASTRASSSLPRLADAAARKKRGLAENFGWLQRNAAARRQPRRRRRDATLRRLPQPSR